MATKAKNTEKAVETPTTETHDSTKVVVSGTSAEHAAEVIKAIKEVLPDIDPIVDEVRRQGRPVDPHSERQRRLAKYAEKRKAGLLKRGRPVEDTSERQQRLEAYKAKQEAGEELRRGRPVDPNSERQQRILSAQLKAEGNSGLRKGVEVDVKDHPQLSKMKHLKVVKLSGTEVVLQNGEEDVIKYTIPTDIVQVKQQAVVANGH